MIKRLRTPMPALRRAITGQCADTAGIVAMVRDLAFYAVHLERKVIVSCVVRISLPRNDQCTRAGSIKPNGYDSCNYAPGERLQGWAAVKRGLSKKEAADYCGCETLAAFDAWRRKGIIPDAIPRTNKWDRKALDVALDRASGLVTETAELSPYQRWKAGNAPSKTQAA